MPRGPRISYPNAVFHVINRFIDRHPFFRRRQDYQEFLDIFFEEADTFGLRAYAYSLMPNHFHVVLETPSGDISRFLQRWLSRAAQQMNRRKGRVGHLFQGRTKTLIVEKESYFRTVVSYVLLNRVRAGLAKDVFSDPWNSVREMTTVRASHLARAPLWKHLFGHAFDDRRARQHIRECLDWLKQLDPKDSEAKFREGHHGGFLSTVQFRQGVLNRIERRTGDKGGFRRKMDRRQQGWTWDEIDRNVIKAVQQNEIPHGLWRTQEQAIRQIRWYVAHVGAGWTWNMIRREESMRGIKETGQAMAVSRIRQHPKKRGHAESILDFCKKNECYNVKE